MHWPLTGVTPGATGSPNLPATTVERRAASWAPSVARCDALSLVGASEPRRDALWGDLPAANFPDVGDNFLGFRLVAELGRGAFGRVYLARQDDLAERLVALKVSAEGHAESQNLAQLQHTHIVPVYSVHRAGAVQAVCMPYFGSATLADVVEGLQQRKALPASGKGLVSTIQGRAGQTRASLDRASAPARAPSTLMGASAPPVPPPAPALGPPPTLRMLEGLTYVEAVLWIGERLADGLAHAHERGIVHRDLKPANVLLTDDGQPMLLDFNLAADLKVDVARARVGGTLPYMAPEHLASFANKPASFPAGALPDARSDVYALGIILHELLTGQRPFPQPTGSPHQLIAEMIRDRLAGAPRVGLANRGVTPAVESIVRHCLEPDPARRYQSARQLAEDLERQRTHRPLAHAREGSLRERAAKWLRRNRRGAVLGAGALAVSLIFCLAGGLTSRNHRLARLEATANLAAFHEERAEAGLLLGARPEDDDQRREGLQLAHRALARYGVLEGPTWRERPAVSRLPPAERGRLDQAVGELLLLAAGAGGPDQTELTERAAACFPPDEAPRSLYAQQAALAELRGDRAEAKALRDAAWSVPVRTATDHYLQGRDLAAKGRFVQASASLREALRLDSKHFAAWYLLGNCCLDGSPTPGAGETEAIRCYTACLALRPNFYGSYFNRGLARLRLGEHPDADSDFAAVLKLRPGLADAHLYRGLARKGRGQPKEALAELDRAIRLGCRSSRAFFERALLRRNLGDRAGGDRAEKEAFALLPRDAESYVYRGVVLAGADPKAALADFRAAVRLSPHSLVALYNEALILERLREYQEAILVLDKVTERHPNLAAPWATRALLHARLGQRAAARRDASQACKLAGRSGEVLYRAACAHALTSGDHPADREEALRLLALALRRGFGHDRLRSDPNLASLRKGPRFEKLVEAAHALEAPTLPTT